MRALSWVLPGAVVCLFSAGMWGQADVCSVPAPDTSSPAQNMFNDQQEQYLGDALAEYFEQDMRIAAPSADDQLTRIGERLLRTLPPTGIHYQFRVYDSGEINGFSIAGGRVYISRKLITAVTTEDELAGVLAHEIGHLATHQTAINVTKEFLRMGVVKVGDREDIFARVHQMLDSPQKSGSGREDEKAELAADRVAIYAMVRAGYAPESFATFFDRVSENRGKTSNWFTNTFGITKEDTQRYTASLKLIGVLPAACKGVHTSNGDAFHAWIRGVAEERINDVAAGVTNETTIKLQPPLRPTFWGIRFSPDGTMLLGQDEASIVIVDRGTGKLKFRIDAPGANKAQFSPDSKMVVFHDDNLRVERWDISSGKRISTKEIVLFSGCSETVLSPDGRSLACVKLTDQPAPLHVELQIVDVDSGNSVYKDPSFYAPGAFEYDQLLGLATNALEGYEIANEAVSLDGRYLLLSAGSSSLAFDFTTQKPVALRGKLKGIYQSRMAFVGPDRLAVMGGRKMNDKYPLKIYSFPDGQQLGETEIESLQFSETSKANTLLIWPLKDYTAGLMDATTGKILTATKMDGLDAWGDFFVTEASTGGFAVLRPGDPAPQRIGVDVGPLPPINRGLFSADGKFLTVSLKKRAALWDLDSGKQLALMRPYSAAWMDEQDSLIGQFPKYGNWDAQELRFSAGSPRAAELGKLDENTYQYHDLDLHYKPMGRGKNVERHVTLEVKKMEGKSVAWTRDFSDESPALWPAEDDRLVLAWDLSNSAVKAEVKAHPELEKELSALKQRKGLLLETVKPETGASLEQVIIPEADLSKGWNDVRRATVSGDVVLARGEHENTTIYRLKDGSKVGEFFGHPVATNAGLHLIAAVNRENEILLVDEQTGSELKRFTLNSPVRLARITGSQQKVLLILTADQVVHRMAVP